MATRAKKSGRGVRGQKSQMSQMSRPSTLIPYDAGAASEGTRDGYQRMVSRRHYTAPGRHLQPNGCSKWSNQMGSAAAKPIIDAKRRSSSRATSKMDANF